MCRSRIGIWTLVLSILFAVVASCNGRADQKVSSQVQTQDGITKITIENPYFALTFDPARGGRCSRFVFKDTGEQIIGDADVCGMFIDHWAKYTWPSGLLWLPYEYELLGNGKDEIGIHLWVKVPKLGGGKGTSNPKSSLKMPTSPDLIGLTVHKTIWLRADTDMIRVEQKTENSTAESKAAAIYVQHNVEIGGSRFSNIWYMPSVRGIECRIQPDKVGGKTIGPDWILDPTAGWMAVRNKISGRGLLFAFDYNYLQKFYTCGTTAEWFFEPVPIGPGKSYKTEYIIKPTTEFKDFVHGSDRLVADIRADEVGKKVQVYHDIAAVNGLLRNVKVTFKVVGWRSKEKIISKTFQVARLGHERNRPKFTFTAPALNEGVVIKAVVSANGKEERYEYYYAGDQIEHESRYNPFATRGQALAGAKGDAYFRKPPRKRKTFDKPDFATVERPDPARFRVLVVFGLYTHILNLDDALASWRYRGTIAPEFDWINSPPNGVETFPGSYNELFRYNLIILSDVNYKALGDIALEMLCDYVEQGGRLLVTGGPYAFGNGEFEETRFLDVLPVKLQGPLDLKWAGKGNSWDLKPTDASDKLLEGVSFTPQPKVFWHHFMTAKDDTQVYLTAGEQPVLITGTYDKGRVAVLSLSPTGKESQGETAWWDWQEWFPLVQNIVTKLNSEED